MCRRRFLLLATACVLIAWPAIAPAQSILRVNTQQVGFVDMSSGKNPVGMTGYRSGGRRYALVCRFDSGLTVIDTTQPAAPRVLATVPGNYRRVVTYRRYAIASTDNGPTVIIDLSTPAQPRIVGTIAIGAHTLRADSDRLYLNRIARGTLIYALQPNPTSPTPVGVLPRVVHAVNPQGNTLYVHGQQSPHITEIFDATNPASLVSLGGLGVGQHSSDLYIAPGGRKILCVCDDFQGGHLQFWDVTRPAAPTFVSRYRTDPSVAIHDIDVKGAYVYVCYYKDQLRVVDVSDVDRPREVGVWDSTPVNEGGLHADTFQTYPFHDAVYMTQMAPTTGWPLKGLHLLDFFPAFGTGAPGSSNATPRIRWSFGPPTPGNAAFAMRLTGARPASVALLVIGGSRTRWGARTLPTPLADLGAPNVTLYVSPDVLLPVPVDALGNARVPLPVPPNLPLERFYTQWIVLDPGAPNAGGLAATSAGELVLY